MESKNRPNYKDNPSCGNCIHMLDINFSGWVYCNVSKNYPGITATRFQKLETWLINNQVNSYGTCDNWMGIQNDKRT